MATINATNLSLLDHARRMDPDSTIARIVELQDEKNAIYEDIVWREGNLPTGHQFSRRTALPTLTWRKFNQGVAPTKSSTDQVVESCGMLSGLSTCDVALAKLNGNEMAFRLSEDMAFLQKFTQDFVDTLIYGNVNTNPERFQGLLPRFNSTTGTTANQLVAGGGSSGADQTSCWLIGWGDHSIYCFYPKASDVGLKVRDMGVELTSDGTNNFPAYRTWMEWHMGLALEDYRFVSRLHSVDTGNWVADLSAGANLGLLMEDQITTLFSFDGIRPCFYGTRNFVAMLNKQLQSASSNQLSWRSTEGGSVDGNRGNRRLADFNGIPIKFNDAQTETEAVVS
jgi:hypothetical protein